MVEFGANVKCIFRLPSSLCLKEYKSKRIKQEIFLTSSLKHFGFNLRRSPGKKSARCIVMYVDAYRIYRRSNETHEPHKTNTAIWTPSYFHGFVTKSESIFAYLFTK